jgi:monoamine oxidase
MSEPHAIVIGAGLSGLRAARDLSDAGHTAVVLEARDRLGGRAFTRCFSGREERIELGGAWVSTRFHHFVAEEIARYGLELAVSHGGELDIRWALEGDVRHRFPLEGGELFELERALFRIIQASHRIDTSMRRDQQELADLDVSVEEYITSLQLSPRVRDFLYLWAALGSGALPHEWSMLTALSWIAAMDHSAFGWYGAVTDRFELGISELASAIARDGNPHIELSATVASITQAHERVSVATMDGREWSAPCAILATPLGVWPDIAFSPPLPQDKREPAVANHFNRMKKLWLLVENLPDSLFASGWPSGFVQLFPEYCTPEGYHIAMGMSAPPATLDPQDVAALTAAVRQFAPGATVLAVDTHDWAGDPYAKGGWMVNPPGVLSRYHSSLSRREGRLIFAGTDVAVRWMGWIDGALESGARAAREAVDLLR